MKEINGLHRNDDHNDDKRGCDQNDDRWMGSAKLGQTCEEARKEKIAMRFAVTSWRDSTFDRKRDSEKSTGLIDQQRALFRCISCRGGGFPTERERERERERECSSDSGVAIRRTL